MKAIKIGRWLFLFVALTLMSCATPKTRPPEVSTGQIESEAHKQRIMVLKSYVDQQMRLYDVSFKLLKGSVAFCSSKRKVAGYKSATKSSFGDKYREAAIDLFKLGEWPKVIHVVPDSPAQKAGLQVGDEIQEAKEMPAIAVDNRAAGELDPSLLRDERVLRMGILRNGERINIELNAVECCDCETEVIPVDEVNAFTDGKTVYVTRGMMKFVDNELELATVVSHELAHKLRGHPEDQKKNLTTGGGAGLVFDIAAAVFGVNTGGAFSKLGAQMGQMAFSKDREREADYVSMYILARSGYEYENAPNIFHKLAYTEPGLIETKYATSHPSTAERFVALEKTAEEIKVKTARGLPLMPEEKDAPSAPDQGRDQDKPIPKLEVKKEKEEHLAAVSGDTRSEVVKRMKLREKAETNFGDQDLQKMIKDHNFFNSQYNPGGDFPNAFVDNGDGTITDKVTALMWQKGGSPSEMTFYTAGKYVEQLNSNRFSGYGDWRLPTMEELCSLLERNPNKNGKFIDNLFDPAQSSCWTADENQYYFSNQLRAAFFVDFAMGETSAGAADRFRVTSQKRYYVKAVRTVEQVGASTVTDTQQCNRTTPVCLKKWN
jgi:hypothetical protein